jgi:hypothetical protein
VLDSQSETSIIAPLFYPLNLMEMILKFSFIALGLLATFSLNSYAYQCNTVMGGCPTDANAGATAAHMHTDVTAKTPAAQPASTAPASASKTTASPNNANSKKSQGSLMQTINKNVLK